MWQWQKPQKRIAQHNEAITITTKEEALKWQENKALSGVGYNIIII